MANDPPRGRNPSQRDLWSVYGGFVAFTLMWTTLMGGTPEWLEAISVFMTMCVTGAAAILGLSVWREENLGHRRAEMAEEVLLASTKAAEVIRTARAPSLRALGRATDATLSGYEQRLAFVQSGAEVFSELHVVGVKAQLFLSADLAQPIKTLGTLRSEMIMDLQTLIRDQQEPLGPEAEPLLHSARLKVFATSDGDDFSRRCDNALGKIESITMPHVQLARS